MLVAFINRTPDSDLSNDNSSKYYPNKPIKKETALYFLNTGCNRKCRQCYLKNTKVESRNLETAISDIDSLMSNGYNVVPLGSEVLLNPEYLKLYRLTGRKYIRSNGMLIAERPELTERIKNAGLGNIIFTVNTDASNVLETTPLEILERAISISLDAGLNVCESVIICKQNYRDLKGIAEYAIQQGISVIDFLNLMPTNSSLAQLTLNDSEIEQFFEQLAELKKEIPKEVLYMTASRNFGIEYRPNKQSLIEKGRSCPAGSRQKVIGLDNRVYPCVFLMREKDVIGEFGNGEIKLYKPEEQEAEWDCLARKRLKNEGGS